MKRIFSVLVDNRFGELPRIVGLCSGRGFRIEGVVAVELDGGKTMRIDLVIDCDDRSEERLRKLLASQVRVLEAVSYPSDELDLAFIEVEAEGDTVRLRLGGQHGDEESLVSGHVSSASLRLCVSAMNVMLGNVSSTSVGNNAETQRRRDAETQRRRDAETQRRREQMTTDQ